MPNRMPQSNIRLKFPQLSAKARRSLAAFAAGLCLLGCAGSGPINDAYAAESHAVDLANDKCDKEFHKRPFETGRFTATASEDRWLWGWLDPASSKGYSAQVSFKRDRSDAQVEVHYSEETHDTPEEIPAPPRVDSGAVQ